MFFIILTACKEYKDYDPENGKDYLHSYFGYEYSLAKEWNLLDSTYNKVDITSLKIKYDSVAKIIKVKLAIYDKNRIEVSNNDEVLLWYGQSTDQSLNQAILEPERNVISLINFIDKNKEYILYPTQNTYNHAWSIATDPFSNKYININGEQTIHFQKKEVYLINTQNSFEERRKFTQYGIFGNIYDVLKFSRIKKTVRYHIEAESETNKNEILKLDSGERYSISKN